MTPASSALLLALCFAFLPGGAPSSLGVSWAGRVRRVKVCNRVMAIRGRWRLRHCGGERRRTLHKTHNGHRVFSIADDIERKAQVEQGPFERYPSGLSFEIAVNLVQRGLQDSEWLGCIHRHPDVNRHFREKCLRLDSKGITNEDDCRRISKDYMSMVRYMTKENEVILTSNDGDDSSAGALSLYVSSNEFPYHWEEGLRHLLIWTDDEDDTCTHAAI
eukprot:jgi/Bigna1/75584/fgenesh1_pg.35_\